MGKYLLIVALIAVVLSVACLGIVSHETLPEQSIVVDNATQSYTFYHFDDIDGLSLKNNRYANDYLPGDSGYQFQYTAKNRTFFSRTIKECDVLSNGSLACRYVQMMKGK